MNSMMNRLWLHIIDTLKNPKENPKSLILLAFIAGVGTVATTLTHICTINPRITFLCNNKCHNIRTQLVDYQNDYKEKFEINIDRDDSLQGNINDQDKKIIDWLNSDNKKEDILWVYFAQNRNNMNLLLRLKKLVDNNQETNDKSTVTFLTGSAGAGKSFFLRKFWQKYPDDVYRISLSKRISLRGIDTKFVEKIPDLKIESNADKLEYLSEMPSIKNLHNLSLHELFRKFDYNFNSRKHKVLFIDDLDEVSQQTADRILELVLTYREKYIKENKNNPDAKPLHFVVAGRPEAFAPTFRKYKRQNWEIPGSILPIGMPTYRSIDEISVFYDDYLNSPQVSVQLKTIGKKWRDAVIKLVENEDYLKISLQSLDLGNGVFEAILLQLKAAQDISKVNHDTIQESLVSRLEDRAREKHYRPTKTDLYRHLIEDIAAKKWNEVERSSGYFSVNVSDVQPVIDGDKTGQVRIEDVLNRSGVATLNPADAIERRYRFEPAWLHRYYVKKHNERIKQKFEECIQTLGSSK